jgi:hypothetical protein
MANKIESDQIHSMSECTDSIQAARSTRSRRQRPHSALNNGPISAIWFTLIMITALLIQPAYSQIDRGSCLLQITPLPMEINTVQTFDITWQPGKHEDALETQFEFFIPRSTIQFVYTIGGLTCTTTGASNYESSGPICSISDDLSTDVSGVTQAYSIVKVTNLLTTGSANPFFYQIAFTLTTPSTSATIPINSMKCQTSSSGPTPFEY